MVQTKYLLSPSEEPYNIEATKDTSMGQAQLIRKILKNKVKKNVYCLDRKLQSIKVNLAYS